VSEHRGPAPPEPASVDRVSALWRRINEHKLVQWSVAYVALAYGIQHGVTLTAEAFEWPHAVERISMLLLILGLPLVMTLAWYHGARATRHVSKAEMSIISLLLVIGAFLFYTFAQPSERAAEPAPKPPQVQTGELSIAVLPFANLSGDDSQKFFSDGMTEEISAALAKVSGLTVLARSSSFAPDIQKLTARETGRVLNARYLIEGSVRKEGDSVRISAQLVEAESGANVWTETYDRQLTSVFATQEDIARAIAASLRVPLGLQAGAELVSNRGIDPESYQDYLRARTLLRSRGARVADAIKILEPLVLNNKEYAPAWALLANAYYFAPQNFAAPAFEDAEKNRRAYLDYSVKAENAARQAIRLDARQSIALGVMAGIRSRDGKWAEGEDLFKQALALDPNDPDTLHLYRQVLLLTGRLKESMTISEGLLTLEPFVPIFNVTTMVVALANGESDRALEINRKFPVLPGSNAYVLAAKGRFAEAAKALTEVQPLSGSTPAMRAQIATAAELLGHAPAKAPAPLPQFIGPQLVFVYAYVGAAERVLEYPEREFDQHSFDNAPEALYLWGPIGSEARKTERFKALMRKSGLVDYWKARGWPDLCHPVGTEDFECN
jgi:TolB-like protein